MTMPASATDAPSDSPSASPTPSSSAPVTASPSPTSSAPVAKPTQPKVYPFKPVKPAMLCGNPAHIVIPHTVNVLYSLDSVPGPAGTYIAPLGMTHVVTAQSLQGPPHFVTWTIAVKACPKVASKPVTKAPVSHVSASTSVAAVSAHAAGQSHALANTGVPVVGLALGAAVLISAGAALVRVKPHK